MLLQKPHPFKSFKFPPLFFVKNLHIDPLLLEAPIIQLLEVHSYLVLLNDAGFLLYFIDKNNLFY